eukprot:4569595-Prymnesium_polylepis.1
MSASNSGHVCVTGRHADGVCVNGLRGRGTQHGTRAMTRERHEQGLTQQFLSITCRRAADARL